MTNMMTTWDGRQVDSSSEAWRAHCEATTVLRMPKADRLKHFSAVGARRGQAARTELESLVRTIWIDREARYLNGCFSQEEVAARLEAIGGDSAKGGRLRADIEARMDELNSRTIAA